MLSNSIMSIDRWEDVRQWLLERMRIVALFDLPPDVFAETGANTSILIAYKPTADRLRELQEEDYSVFVQDIENVGYEKRTVKRNVVFEPIYEYDRDTFQVKTTEQGEPIRKEDFTSTKSRFKEWALGQEPELREAFLES